MQKSADMINREYTNVLNSLSTVLIAGLGIFITMTIERERSESTLHTDSEAMDLPETLKPRLGLFIESISHLDKALLRLQLNPSAMELLVQKMETMEKRRSALRHWFAHVSSEALKSHARFIVGSLRHLLHRCRETLKENSQGVVLEAFGHTFAHGGYPGGIDSPRPFTLRLPVIFWSRNLSFCHLAKCE